LSLRDSKDGQEGGESIQSLQAPIGAVRTGGQIAWPGQTLGPRPGLKELNVVCWGLLVALGLLIGVLVWNHVKGGEGFDFVYFYGAGRLAAEHPPVRLYDYASQLQVFNSICPSQKTHYGPSPYPPFVGLFFSGLSRLPFRLAYFLWMAVSLALYLIGIRAVLNEVLPAEQLEASLMLCLAIAFPPFLLYTFVNGQLASVAVFCVGLAIYEEGSQKPFLSGLVLSILTYKPTLLLLIVPMLLLTRRFKTLAGFISGAMTLVAISTAFAGRQIWPAYVRLIEAFRKLSVGDVTSGIKGGLRRWQFVDLNSLSYAIPGAHSRLGFVLMAGIALAVASWIAALFWKSVQGERSVQYLTWGTALTWTLLLNIYVPIYDSVLATIAIILTIGALEDLSWERAVRWIVVVAVLIFAVSWITRAIAETHGIQLLTVLLFGFGIAQAFLLQKSIGVERSERNTSLLRVAVTDRQNA